jgi:hypothetical protein
MYNTRGFISRLIGTSLDTDVGLSLETSTLVTVRSHSAFKEYGPCMGRLNDTTSDDVTAVVAEPRQLRQNTELFFSAVLSVLVVGKKVPIWRVG